MLREGSARSGRRAMTVDHLTAKAFARGFDGSNSRRPGQYLAALKQAAGMLGVPRRVVSFIDLLFAFTQPQDWQDGKPIVWPSNTTLQDTLGLSRSGVQHLVRAAIASGVIAVEDSPNGQRYGQRDNEGHITYAYGFNLAPLASRYDEFITAAEAHKAERQKRKELRAKATHLRNEALEYAALTEAQAVADGRDKASALHDRAYDLWCQSRQLECITHLEPIVTALEEVRNEAEALAKAVNGIVDKSPMGAVSEAHITTTTQLPSSEEDTTRIVEENDLGVGRKRPVGTERRGERVKRPAPPSTVPPSSRDIFGSYPVTLDTVFTIAPIFRDFCMIASWQAITDTAQLIGRSLGISQDAWGEACTVLGRAQAAVAVAIIVARHDRGEIKSAGGFLRAIVARHRAGTLHLDRTLYGLTSERLH